MHSSVRIFPYPLLFACDSNANNKKQKMLHMMKIKPLVQIFQSIFTSCSLPHWFTGTVIQGSFIYKFFKTCNILMIFCRTRSIRWKWVCWNFLQVIGVLFYLYFIFVRFCVPVRIITWSSFFLHVY